MYNDIRFNSNTVSLTIIAKKEFIIKFNQLKILFFNYFDIDKIKTVKMKQYLETINISIEEKDIKEYFNSFSVKIRENNYMFNDLVKIGTFLSNSMFNHVVYYTSEKFLDIRKYNFSIFLQDSLKIRFNKLRYESEFFDSLFSMIYFLSLYYYKENDDRVFNDYFQILISGE